MDDAIFRSLQGRATPDEEREVQRWRRLSAGNELRYRRIEELWRLAGESSAVVPRDGELPDVDTLIARAEADHDDGAERAGSGTLPFRPGHELGLRRGPAAAPSGRHRPRRLARALKVAAIAAVLAPGAFLVGRFLERGAFPGDVVLESEISTGSDELTTVTLTDGTSIRVGPRTHLRFAREGADVVAWLDGRAFFAVRPDPTRSFIVRTAHGDAVVLGTRFEVRSEAAEFRVLVVDGSVRVSAGAAHTELGHGDMSLSVDGAAPTVTAIGDVYGQLDWMGNALVFQSTPLSTAIREIERSYGVSVRLDSPALAELTLTVSFTDQPIEHVVLVLCETVGATCTVENGVVRISDTPRTGSR